MTAQALENNARDLGFSIVDDPTQTNWIFERETPHGTLRLTAGHDGDDVMFDVRLDGDDVRRTIDLPADLYPDASQMEDWCEEFIRSELDAIWPEEAE